LHCSACAAKDRSGSRVPFAGKSGDSSFSSAIPPIPGKRLALRRLAATRHDRWVRAGEAAKSGGGSLNGALAEEALRLWDQAEDSSALRKAASASRGSSSCMRMRPMPARTCRTCVMWPGLERPGDGQSLLRREPLSSPGGLGTGTAKQKVLRGFKCCKLTPFCFYILDRAPHFTRWSSRFFGSANRQPSFAMPRPERFGQTADWEPRDAC